MSVKTVPSARANAVAKNMAKLLKLRLLVGIPGSAGQHSDSKVSLSTIGYLNEMGDDELHIPARPFLVPGVESVQDKIVQQMAQAGATILAGGSIDAAEIPIMRAGLIAQTAVKDRMANGPFTPLAASTIYKRKHRKNPPPRSRETPLIDTGELQRNIQYAIDRG